MSGQGAKAMGLRRLADAGFPVPPFFVWDHAAAGEAAFNAQMEQAFGSGSSGGNGMFAVRSSSSEEDAAHASFAGQFTTFLNVPRGEVYARVAECFAATDSASLRAYREATGESAAAGAPVRMSVIVQEMVESELSGVIFTANPQGVLNEMVFVVGSGTGDRVVDDMTDVCTVYYNRDDRRWYAGSGPGAPAVSADLVEELAGQALRIREAFGYEADIEFAVKDGAVYILQCRPITTLPDGDVTILDNSNLVESYPGITMPLTDSFIRYAYAGVVERLLGRICGSARKAGFSEETLSSMVTSYKGRMYYKINHWYRIISLLPFARRIFPVWERSLGLSPAYRRIYPVPLRVKLRVAVSFVRLIRSAPRLMENLERIFADVSAYFRAAYRPGLGSAALLEIYDELSARIFPEWDVTLVNDLYAFLYAGRLAKKYPEEANEILADVTGLASMEPAAALQQLKQFVAESGAGRALAALNSDADVRAFLAADSELAVRMKDYIERYGDRYFEELKLESPTFRSEPLLLVRKILPPEEAGAGQPPVFKDPPARGGRTAEKAKAGIRNREISRLNRSRIYGMVRTIFLDIGANFVQGGILSRQKDIFYLTVEEIRAIVSGQNPDAGTLAEERREQYKQYEELPAYSRVVLTPDAEASAGAASYRAGAVVYTTGESQAFSSGEREAGLTGTPCSAGVAIAEAVVVRSPEGQNVKGKILIAESTDPGWVFLLAQAAGIIAERGSLLSHTAIVSRELHVPSVVGVKDATKRIRSGDRVRLDGSTGRIEILERAPCK